ncbi:mycothiol conjugate amidase Mca [Amycolatopsis anabasis]|uniref:mycothiol conjugate amidase Mca n=1 Tax=Amycolatopsis anabasis TaxID=1840409 RepID=UPI00131B5B76|nr:mycothiol conjugate amidase Mca [Amycolatopsis anabasis]
MTLRLMTVHAHPDDESSKGAATMARYAAEGVDVLVCTCTGGERGDVLNPRLDRPEVRRDLPAIRRREMAAAREILGVRHRFLGFADSGLPGPGEALPEGCFARQPVAEAARPLVAAIREFRPHVLVTYDENGGYPHPDHLMTHRVTMAAIDAAADPARHPETGAPWETPKLYYLVSFSREWFQAMYDGMTARGLPSSHGEVLAELDPDAPSWPVTTRVPCGEYFEVRDRALLAHATQIDPDGPNFSCPLDVQREIWPTEDYHLVRSTVEVSLPEADLFAGIAPPRPGRRARPGSSAPGSVPAR